MAGHLRGNQRTRRLKELDAPLSTEATALGGRDRKKVFLFLVKWKDFSLVWLTIRKNEAHGEYSISARK